MSRRFSSFFHLFLIFPFTDSVYSLPITDDWERYICLSFCFFLLLFYFHPVFSPFFTMIYARATVNLIAFVSPIVEENKFCWSLSRHSYSWLCNFNFPKTCTPGEEGERKLKISQTKGCLARHKLSCYKQLFEWSKQDYCSFVT